MASTRNQTVFIDNGLPENYPQFSPADFLGDKDMIVEDGNYIVDRNGHLLEVTHGNARYAKSSHPYDTSINIHYFRAKYLSNADDGLGYANQIRLATKDEIQTVKDWLSQSEHYKANREGQLILF